MILMRTQKIAKNIKDIWSLKYHVLIPIIVDVVGIYVCWKYKIYLWNSKYYGELLTAVITFLSIVISVFGILIPTVFNSKSKLVAYFINNIDTKYFVSSVKNVIISGISEVIVICILYAYDVIPLKIYVLFCVISVFLLIYFVCGSYKYISLMLRLALEEKEPVKGKKYKNQLSDDKRQKINDMLRNENKDT